MKLFVRNYNKEMCSLKHKILEFSLLAEDTWRPKMVNNFQNLTLNKMQITFVRFILSLNKMERKAKNVRELVKL